MTPYRNDDDALRERKSALEAELGRLREETRSLEGLRSRESEIEKELEALSKRIGAKRALPLLDRVRVASPCNARWDEMVGDERVRFCLSCEKNVYNLSAMPAVEAERLLREKLGGELCVRFFQRADGTILTEDCPVGVRKKRRKKLALAVAGAGAMAVAATSMLTRAECKHMQGAIAVSPPERVEETMGKPAPPPHVAVMGTVAPPRPQQPPPAQPPVTKKK